MSTMSTVEGYRALLVPADTTEIVREIVIADGGDHGLTDLRKRIGCSYIEHVRGPGCSLWVDEEGALTPRRPSNPRIDALLMRSDGWSIRGDVVITGTAGPEGETGSLPADDAARLQEVLRR
jgi:hypothetical protein